MIVVLTGTNVHTLTQELHALIADFTVKYGYSIERFDGSEMPSADVVLDAVRSISFLEPRKMVIVRDFSQHKDLLDIIESIIEQTADSTDLVLVDAKLDKRTAGYKYLKKHTDVREHKQLAPYELDKWLVAKAKENDAELSLQDAKYLIERVGPNQQLLGQEVIKLALVASKITKKTIEEMTDQTPQSKVFDMLDALFQGKLDAAWRLYRDQRAQGEEPQKIMAMIIWQLSQLTLAVFAPVKTKEALIAVGMSPYGAQKSLETSRHISQKDMQNYISELATIDAQTKTSADVESALETYFSYICSK